MTALPQDAVADLQQRIAELERQLETAVEERDAAIERQTASALVNFRLKNELRTATDRQKASAEILNAIANTHGDAEHALQRIAETTATFFGAAGVTIRIAEGDRWIQTVRVGAGSLATGAQPAADFATRGHNVPGTVYAENRQIHIPDLDNIDPSMAKWPATAARAAGIRTICGTPLRRGAKAIGALIVYRDRLAPFTDDELALQQSFADQAVIAIENARLFNETQEALERQTATSEILRVISGSPTDVRPVFVTILQTAVRLMDCDRAFVMRIEGNSYFPVATATHDGSLAELGHSVPIDPDANFPSRAIVGKTTVFYPDWSLIELPDFERRVQDNYGINCSLFLPLLREGECIGLLILVSKQPGKFGDKEIALAESFRDQALIAIENTRLFNETREALERQTATADILKVIASSPADTQPVFEAIAGSAKRLLGGYSVAVFRLIDENVHLAAYTPTNPAADEALKADFPQPVENFEAFRLAQHGKPFPIPDTEEVPHQPLRDIARIHGFRSMLWVPITNSGVTIGIISVTRTEPGAFAPHHVQLLQTFADQAVIAIENTRLFNETQDALERQTATADILKVIASSPSDVQPVFDAIVSSAAKLFEPCSATITTLKDGMLHWNATATSISGFSAESARTVYPLPFDPERAPSARAMLERRIIEYPDAASPDTPEFTRRAAAAGGFQSITFVPLIDQEQGIGTIIFTHPQTGYRFSEKQLALIQTFADQAVIAIKNMRLFNEVQERTVELTESLQQQTATSEVLQIISSSPGDLTPVFDKMLENATRVCGAEFGSMLLVEDGGLRQAALYNAPAPLAAVRAGKLTQYDPQSAPAIAISSRKVVQIDDVRTSAAYLKRAPATVQIAELGGARTIVVVPMLRDDEAIGSFTVYRQEVRPFSEKQVELLTNFARQAVIAIENARLLRELRQRTDDLSKSLDDLRTAQDRLVQTEKLASLGQLTAGIAHEIKNPLNFVNNFSSLSVELTDELNDILKQAELADAIRAEIDELTGLLKSNLEKVVQHGKRADSIVKNMLLHSREGSGEHRPADINALVDESLNLAYHGARAEKPQFNVTLQRNFDPEAGMVEMFPQEITRVFLNLLSNGFYAVTKRKADNGAGFEPVVSATTKSCAHGVEIRIRDNGTGIPPDVKEKMFNPFFTTKPAGEGTGLGLSMSYDIIVKQHGGTIDVETLPGEFTEFTIVLPRTSVSKKN